MYEDLFVAIFDQFIRCKDYVNEPIPAWFGVPCLRNDHVLELVVDFIGEINPIIHFNRIWCN